MTVHPLLGQVNGQPQYSHLAGDQRPWHARSTHPPSYTGVSNKSQINSKLTSCCLSQFKQDTGEPSMSTQEINPIRYLPTTLGYRGRQITTNAFKFSFSHQLASKKYIIYGHNLTLHSKYTTYQSLSQCLLH